MAAQQLSDAEPSSEIRKPRSHFEWIFWTLGQLLKRAPGSAAILALISAGLSVLLVGPRGPELTGGMVLSSLALWIVNAFIGGILVALTLDAVRGVEKATPPGLAEALRTVQSQAGSLLQVSFLVFLILNLPGALLTLLASNAETGGLTLGMLVLGLFVFIFFFYLASALSVAVPALVEEGHGALATLSRSMALTHGRRLAVFGVMIVVGIATGFATVLVLFIMGIVLSPLARLGVDQDLLVRLLPAMGDGMTLVIYAAVQTGLYLALQRQP